MPYLNITTNAPVNKRQKETIERAISKAILLIPKEKEELLMVNFEDCASLSLSGDFSTPAAMIELRVHNVVIEMNEAELLEKVMSLATEVVSKVLDICPDRIYCTMPADQNWTAAGQNNLKGILKKLQCYR